MSRPPFVRADLTQHRGIGGDQFANAARVSQCDGGADGQLRAMLEQALGDRRETGSRARCADRRRARRGRAAVRPLTSCLRRWRALFRSHATISSSAVLRRQRAAACRRRGRTPGSGTHPPASRRMASLHCRLVGWRWLIWSCTGEIVAFGQLISARRSCSSSSMTATMSV